MRSQTIVVAAIAGLVLSGCDWHDTSVSADDPLADGELDAGYIPYPPSLAVDPNTGEFSGISYDVLEAISADLGVKLDPDEELAWGTMIENLKNGRSEIVATGIWPTPDREKQASFSKPIFYSPVYAYVRAGDSRFDNNLAAANSESVSIATLDGEIAETVANEDFPKAKQVSLPQLNQVSELLLNVAQGKADMTFVEPAIADEFLEANPGSIVKVKLNRPVRAFPTTFMVPKGDDALLAKLNNSLAKLQANGTVDRIIDKYEERDDTFLRVTEFDPSAK